MQPSKQKDTLWIGGSSSLTKTYVNKYGGDSLLLAGLESKAPQWVEEMSIDYMKCDLTTLTDESSKKIFLENEDLCNIIVGVRPILFAAYTDIRASKKIIEGIKTLLRQAAQLKRRFFVLHISSVAAVDHLRTQKFASEKDAAPPLSEYNAPYDIFKRQSEEAISILCSQEPNISACHLRLSAIFSDDSTCIQCSALGLQARVGCYLPLPIDCNSSVNVASAIRVILKRAHNHPTTIKPCYYYTRPLRLPRPVPYGYYLKAFREAYGIDKSSIWIPVWVVTWFVAFFHFLASWNVYFHIPYIDAADYLLQVAAREHSFDCSLFGNDFQNDLEEETILECFVRRREFLENSKKNR